MKIENTEVYGLKESMFRSGYPMSTFVDSPMMGEIEVDSESKLYQRSKHLAQNPAGSGHNNFLKGIIVQFDLQYPQYFTPQLQRYHWIDIVSSQSKMHRLCSKTLTEKDFTPETDYASIELITSLIKDYQSSSVAGKKDLFKRIISNLPMGYYLWMGISTNYLQLKTVFSQRRHHKLDEWQYFCDWIETLPNSNLITYNGE